MRSLLALAILGLLAAPASAQDYTADGNYGTVALEEYFTPDPHTIDLTAGGSVAVDQPGCAYGFVANAPDYELDYTTSGASALYLYATSDDDTTLLVNLPDGSWACDDDSFGDGDPLLGIEGAPSGRYDIWVGTYGDEMVRARLHISERDPSGGMDSAGAPDPNADANYGSVDLDGGFPNDPYTVGLTAGGGIAVDVDGCGYGYVSDAPDYKLTYSGGNGRDLYVYATSGDDTTLLVNLPDGSWACDDDSFGDGDPLLGIEGAPDGRYDIWIGTFGETTAPATLYISERDPAGGGTATGGAPDPSAESNYGEVDLDEGFLPDPHVVELTAGGGLDVQVDAPGCSFGSVTEAPDYKLHYTTSGNSPLYLYATSGEDTTLLVNLPDGSWACNDDSYGDGDPLLYLPGASGGRYDIWVGTFGGGTADATFFISERDPR